MERQKLRAGKLTSAGYDERSRVMEIELANGDVFEYKGVSPELFRQLTGAPSPTSFFKDKVDEQFSGKRLAKSSKSSAADAFDWLFGKA
ncbi:MAG: KTSC domain-containing protein [Betaproteobacteria bacterium]|nr:MAG: KTSC domain-containing protein [Betaproteobacteria bacterium]